jgi:hypothetical protein
MAVAAFGRGDYAEAADLLLAVQGKSNRFGGSHAQRDIFSWTLTEAAIRAGDRPLAEAMIAERLARKPQSPLNKAWSNRIGRMANQHAALGSVKRRNCPPLRTGDSPLLRLDMGCRCGTVAA